MLRDPNEAAAQVTNDLTDLTLEELQFLRDIPDSTSLISPRASRVDILDEEFPTQDTPRPGLDVSNANDAFLQVPLPRRENNRIIEDSQDFETNIENDTNIEHDFSTVKNEITFQDDSF